MKGNDRSEELHQALVNLALSFYADEPCRICGKTIIWDEIKDAVWAGYSADNMARSAHGACFERCPWHGEGPVPDEWVHK